MVLQTDWEERYADLAEAMAGILDDSSTSQQGDDDDDDGDKRIYFSGGDGDDDDERDEDSTIADPDGFMASVSSLQPENDPDFMASLSSFQPENDQDFMASVDSLQPENDDDARMEGLRSTSSSTKDQDASINQESMDNLEPENDEDARIEELSEVNNVEEDTLEEILDEGEDYDEESIDENEVFSEDEGGEEEGVEEDQLEKSRGKVIDELKERLSYRASPYPPPTVTSEWPDTDDDDQNDYDAFGHEQEYEGTELSVQTVSEDDDDDEFIEETIHEGFNGGDDFYDETDGDDFFEETVHEYTNHDMTLLSEDDQEASSVFSFDGDQSDRSAPQHPEGDATLDVAETATTDEKKIGDHENSALASDGRKQEDLQQQRTEEILSDSQQPGEVEGREETKEARPLPEETSGEHAQVDNGKELESQEPPVAEDMHDDNAQVDIGMKSSSPEAAREEHAQNGRGVKPPIMEETRGENPQIYRKETTIIDEQAQNDREVEPQAAKTTNGKHAQIAPEEASEEQAQIQKEGGPLVPEIASDEHMQVDGEEKPPVSETASNENAQNDWEVTPTISEEVGVEHAKVEKVVEPSVPETARDEHVQVDGDEKPPVAEAASNEHEQIDREVTPPAPDELSEEHAQTEKEVKPSILDTARDEHVQVDGEKKPPVTETTSDEHEQIDRAMTPPVPDELSEERAQTEKEVKPSVPETAGDKQVQVVGEERLPTAETTSDEYAQNDRAIKPHPEIGYTVRDSVSNLPSFRRFDSTSSYGAVIETPNAASVASLRASFNNESNKPIMPMNSSDPRIGQSLPAVKSSVMHAPSNPECGEQTQIEKDVESPAQEGKSIFHEMLEAGNFDSVLTHLQKLQTEDDTVIRNELSRVDGVRKETPIHVAVLKGLHSLTKLFIKAIPAEYREGILIKQDVDGNTPLHLACANLELTVEDNSMFDASAIKSLTKGAFSAHEVMNNRGDCPLASLMMSSAMRADSNRKEAEETAENMVRSILERQMRLASAQNSNGRTLLHIAIGHGVHERVLEALIEAAGPTDAEKPYEDGKLPLHYAVSCMNGRCPSVAFVEKLVKTYPEAITHGDNVGETPLHIFVRSIQKEISDQEERSSLSFGDVTALLMGEGDHESACPLLVKNQESVRKREMTVFGFAEGELLIYLRLLLLALAVTLLRTVQCASACCTGPDGKSIC